MSLDYPILPICQTAESFRNILSAMGPYRDSISLKKSPLLGLYTGSEAQLDLATVRYHALGAYAKSVYLVIMMMRIATQQWRNLISEGVVAGPQMFDEKQICGARPEIFTTMGSSS